MDNDPTGDTLLDHAHKMEEASTSIAAVPKLDFWKDNKQSKKRKAPSVDVSNNSSSSSASETKEKKVKQRVDICEGKPTQEIIYKDCTFGVDLKVMAASCMHPIYQEDEISKAAKPGDVWEISSDALDVPTPVMTQFLRAIHKPFEFDSQHKRFTRWALFFRLSNYFLHDGLYKLAAQQFKLNGALLNNWDEMDELLLVLKDRRLPTKQQTLATAPREFIYCTALYFCARIFVRTQEDVDQIHEDDLLCLKKFRRDLLCLSPAVTKDVLQVLTIPGFKEPQIFEMLKQ